ncbi:helix-turn-helix domain-containing protein [Komagataeibacter medellinensis]|uniref:Transposase n=1 Tax=Komagataeibacter medellinensis (strain NBRC 3288 / BCRC 11682 / LMG 1693 / Kondo 51) TaxID=634177 RepID=G2I2F2_KOMMN|nr:helix-turn-helix domain-containing protein [Komagataeibacter medellinensis]BAK82568.1 transposase [Komagataeibacter medellinensis NBRC 3288]
MELTAVAIKLMVLKHQKLEALPRAHKTGQSFARRVRLVLAATNEHENKAIRDLIGADINTVDKGCQRFVVDRLDGLYDEPRPGTPRLIGNEKIAETIH